jgi:integrase
MDVHDEALLALFAGLRAGEIHKLTWGDVDFSTGTMFIRDAKNGTSRHAFLNAEIHSMLLRRYKEQAKADYVFPAEGGKLREWVPDTFARTVAALGMNEGVTDARQKVVFHTLRHTFASWLVMRGVPLYDVAKLVGHINGSTYC